MSEKFDEIIIREFKVDCCVNGRQFYKGSTAYFKRLEDGKEVLHRTGGPAVINIDGSMQYWVDGNRHREDGPAVILANGSLDYWVDGKRHRTDGPAVIWGNGFKQYYINGKLHRTDGPAVIGADGMVEYYVYGKRLSEKDFKDLQASMVTSREDKTIEIDGKCYRLVET